MTNKELQHWLAQFPADVEVYWEDHGEFIDYSPEDLIRVHYDYKSNDRPMDAWDYDKDMDQSTVTRIIF